MLQKLENSKSLCVKAGDAEGAFEDFCSQFVIVQAGGGLVRNDRGEVLMIYRNGRWDLPKGHVEKGETTEEGALREVREETGLQTLTSSGLIVSTFHFYDLDGRWRMKRTWWYSMYSTDKNLVPQTQEGITKVEWIPVDKLVEYAENSFETVRRVISSAQVNQDIR